MIDESAMAAAAKELFDEWARVAGEGVREKIDEIFESAAFCSGPVYLAMDVGAGKDLVALRMVDMERDAKIIMAEADEMMIEHLGAAARALDEASLPTGKHMAVLPGGEILEMEVPPETAETGGRQSGDRNWMNLQPRYGRRRR